LLPTRRTKLIHATLDRFFYARLQHSPEQATSLGLDTGPRAKMKSRLDDMSRAVRRDSSREQGRTGNAENRYPHHAEQHGCNSIPLPTSHANHHARR
jgi:hypothetical protein